jgi:hypothetical protein
MGILNWLKQQSAKEERAVRHLTPGIIAHYWDGGAPKGHPVKDMSATGAYLYATEQWWIGTLIAITLQGPAGAASALSLRCKVVRRGPDGIGINFMLRSGEEQKALKHFISAAVARESPGTSGKDGD